MKFVLIGTGNIAKTYISAIKNIDDTAIVGVVSNTLGSNSTFNNIDTFKTLKDVDREFDTVIVCSPNGLHHVDAIQSAKLKKHVLCEKPIDISIDSIDKMISACKQNGVKLGVAYQRRLSSDNPLVKQLLSSGKIGKIFSVDLAVKNYRDDDYYNSSAYRGTYKIDGGGPFIQQASHYIDLYYWFFGKPAKLVSKLNTFVHNIEVEDHGTAICVHDSGLIGTITASTATKPGFPAKMEVYSDKGYFIIENDIITQWEIDGLANPSSQSGTNTHSGSSSPFVDDTTNHELIIKDFINAVEENRDPFITGESAKNATEIILEIYKNQF
ncbi:MAG: gfo/Idh/MocA family oxidoreductase [Calditrichaeota bacterium]|nr:MAG: gfo/Idh/MocA family oxidoreductase [Calditrichota bacterium]MBL1204751.1 gfo/Idh/MocA family oxidoreductase [Calditrichota bacterium]NOG44579.1 Gfo/Idh/MocA family oxidoreductase [Calditrichota bacterium]